MNFTSTQIFTCPTSMKYWEQIRLILIYGECPRLKLLLLTKSNIHPCLSGFSDSKDTILTQGGLGIYPVKLFRRVVHNFRHFSPVL